MSARRRSALLAAVFVALLAPSPAPRAADPPRRTIAPADVRSGRTFLTPQTQAQQDDLADNPGMLWVEEGARLWNEPAGEAARSCASCHGEAEKMHGVAARYPAFDVRLDRLLNLETRIQNCRSEHQRAAPPAYESQPLLALTALVAHQSRGVPLAVRIDGPAAEHFRRGEHLFHEPQGQLDISCAQCHVERWGSRLRTETISQGYSNGFPAYRLEWQTLGSSHRRLRACFLGVRAEPFAAGSREFIELELYLAWRAEGLPVETPAVRR